MPPRHTYWTILFGDKPTAFRSATQEELLPTFKQIQSKHPDAVMMWFARGKLWKTEEDARAAFQRPRFDRPGPPPESQNRSPRPEWRDKPRGPRPEWKSKPRFDRPPGPPKPDGRGGEWRDKPQGPRPEWKDKPRFDRPPGQKPEWQSRGPKPPWRDKPRDDRPRDPSAFARKPSGPGYGGTPPKPGGKGGEWRDRPRGPKPAWKDKPRDDRPRGPKPSAFARKPSGPGYGETPPKPGGRGGEWKDKPRFDRPPGPPRSDGPPKGDTPPADDRRGRDWRPGGKHKDPRDRFKVPRDVKRARFKQNLWSDRSNPKPAPPKPRSGEGGPRKKKDDEE
jgi:hypothetical protein